MERQGKAESAFRALQERFGPSSRFASFKEIPDEQRGSYYGFWLFLEEALKSVGDPLLTKEMSIDSLFCLQVTRGSDYWRVEGWLILFGFADVGFSAIFQDRAPRPRCRFRPAAKRRMEHDHELGEYDFFAFKG